MANRQPDIFVLLLICFGLACIDLCLLYKDKLISLKYLPTDSTITPRNTKLSHLHPNGDYQKPYIDTPQWRTALKQSKYQNDSDCTRIGQVPKGSWKLRLLYASRGSGSTCLRYLLELASGFYTGSHYRDDDDYIAGLIGEAMDPFDKLTFIVHSKVPNVTRVLPEAAFEEAVILIRNPFKSILSSYYEEQFNKVGFIDDDLFHTREWVDFATLESNKWLVGASWTCKTVRPSMTVFYEDLVNKTEAELRRILTFLGMEPSSERVKCALSHSRRVFKKYEASTTPTMDPYTEELKDLINRRIDSLRNIFKLETCGSIPQYEKEVPFH